MNDKYELVERSPSVAEYRKLRVAVGWGDVDAEAAEIGLSNSLFSVCVTFENAVIGYGRVVGDGGIYFYIQDVIVLPEHRGQGIGERIMNALLGYINTNARPNAFIGLMAAEEKVGFYKRFGFRERPLSGPGMFMVIK